MIVRADLHNHSCLSPCASLEMSPSRLAAEARAAGVGVLALTDHNAAFNCPAFAVACAREGIIPLFGMELNPREEAHLLALFAAPRLALEFARRLEPLLPPVPLRPDVLGDEVVVDADENVLELYDLWLGAALDAGFDELARMASDAGGLVIPAHVDRPAMSVYSQLGFLPEGPYDAVESIGPVPRALCGEHAIISGSDAHYPEHVARRPFEIELPDEPAQALRKEQVRFASDCPIGSFAVGDNDDRAHRTDGELMVSMPAKGLARTFAPVSAGAESPLWEALLVLPCVTKYPEGSARDFMESFRAALHEKKVKPTHVSRPLVL